MTEDILREVRASSGLKNAILGSVELQRATAAVTVRPLTDLSYTDAD